MVPPASLDEGGVDKLIDYEKTLLLTVCCLLIACHRHRADVMKTPSILTDTGENPLTLTLKTKLL